MRKLLRNQWVVLWLVLTVFPVAAIGLHSGVQVVMADQHEAVAPEMIQPSHEAAEPEAEAEAAAEEPKPEPLKVPWLVMFLWPFISTALISVIKALSDRFEKEVPPQLWPIANAVIAAVIAAIQMAKTPQELIAALPAAILGALGLTKLLDGFKGKVATLTPAEKAAFKKAVAEGKIVV